MHAALVAVAPLILSSVFASAADGATIGGNPGPAHNYVCPHADGKPQLECYFDAVQHLYTMCRNVKSIEIIEFGFENSREGVNAAKSESCLDKQKQNIALPFKAALREAAKSKQAVADLHGLQDTWVAAMTGLQWQAGESGSDYQSRVGKPYDEFNRRIDAIRASAAETDAKMAAAKAAKARKSKPAKGGKAKPAAKAKKR